MKRLVLFAFAFGVLVGCEKKSSGLSYGQASKSNYESREYGISLAIPSGWEPVVAFIGGAPSAPKFQLASGEVIEPVLDLMWKDKDWQNTKGTIRLLVYKGNFTFGEILTEPERWSFSDTPLSPWTTKDGFDVLAGPVEIAGSYGVKIHHQFSLTDILGKQKVNLSEDTLIFKLEKGWAFFILQACAEEFEKTDNLVFQPTINSINVSPKMERGPELVVGMAEAMDKESGFLKTPFVARDIFALWSRTGWKGKHIYFEHDSKTFSNPDKVPWTDEKDKVTWLPKDQPAPKDHLKLLVWKVKDLKRNTGGDASIDLNRPGLSTLQTLLRLNYVALTNIQTETPQAYLFSPKDIKSKSTQLKNEGVVLIKFTPEGKVSELINFAGGTVDQEGLKKIKLSLSEPAWYPRLSSGR